MEKINLNQENLKLVENKNFRSLVKETMDESISTAGIDPNKIKEDILDEILEEMWLGFDKAISKIINDYNIGEVE